MLIIEIPEELLILIFRKLKHVDLCKIACTCRYFRQISADNQVWRETFRRDFRFTFNPKLRRKFYNTTVRRRFFPSPAETKMVKFFTLPPESLPQTDDNWREIYYQYPWLSKKTTGLMGSFYANYTEGRRVALAKGLQDEYAQCCPVIVEQELNWLEKLSTKKHQSTSAKWVVPWDTICKDFTRKVAGEFTRYDVISYSKNKRKPIDLLFTIETAYQTWREDDGLLYIVYKNRVRQVVSRTMLLIAFAVLLLITVVALLY